MNEPQNVGGLSRGPDGTREARGDSGSDLLETVTFPQKEPQGGLNIQKPEGVPQEGQKPASVGHRQDEGEAMATDASSSLEETPTLAGIAKASSFEIKAGVSLLHYQIRRKIGEGGMGKVFGATDTYLKREVAIKILHPKLVKDPEVLLRFQREAQTLAQVRHPNVVQIYGLHEYQGIHFFAMEFIKGGESLKDYLASRKYLDEREALSLVQQITRGLAAIHKTGIVHRDIKPANIILDKGIPRITDFGVARWHIEESGERVPSSSESSDSSDITREGKIVGTPAYLAPECFRGEKASFGSDIYALGVMFYEMLSGQKLFGNLSLQQVIIAHMTQKPPLLSTVYPRVSRDLSLIVEKMIAQDHAKRFQDTSELLQALDGLSQSWQQARESLERRKLQKEMARKFNFIRLVLISALVVLSCLTLLYFLKDIIEYLRTKPKIEPVVQKVAPGSDEDDTIWKEGKWARVCGVVVEDFADAEATDDKGLWLILSNSLQEYWIYLPEETLKLYSGFSYQKGKMFAFQGKVTRAKAEVEFYLVVGKKGLIDCKSLDLAVDLGNRKYETVREYQKEHCGRKGKARGSILYRQVNNDGLWLLVGKPYEQEEEIEEPDEEVGYEELWMEEKVRLQVVGVQIHNEVLWHQKMDKNRIRIGDILDVDGIIKTKTILLPDRKGESRETEIFYLDVAAGMYCQILFKAPTIEEGK